MNLPLLFLSLLGLSMFFERARYEISRIGMTVIEKTQLLPIFLSWNTTLEISHPLVYSDIRDKLLPNFLYEHHYRDYARRATAQLDQLVEDELLCFRNNQKHCLSHDSAENMIASKPYKDNELVMKDPIIYPAVIEPQISAYSDTQVIIAIPTSPSQYIERIAIRATWCNSTLTRSKKVKCVFCCATSDISTNVDQFLKEEAELYNDIVQFPFRNSYLNLTRLQFSSYSWIAKHIPSAKFIIRSDSDMFVNPDLIVKKLIPYPKKNFIYGVLIDGGIPIRHPLSKYYFPKWLFAEDRFPAYVSGCFYIWSTDVLGKVINASDVIRPIHYIDDVYYGQIFRHYKLRITPDRGYLYWDQIPISNLFFTHVAAAHRYSPIDLKVIWKLYHQSLVCSTNTF